MRMSYECDGQLFERRIFSPQFAVAAIFTTAFFDFSHKYSLPPFGAI